MKRDFLAISDLTTVELEEILLLAARLKGELRAGQVSTRLAGKSLAMVFEKPSLRTRVTFEVGMIQLGGYAVYLTPTDIRLGERESVADIARNLDRVVNFIMARTMSHETQVQLSQFASVPVVNGLSDLVHPCQVLSDCFTISEKLGRLAGVRVAFLGDGNNMANSWMNAAARFGLSFALARPANYGPDAALLESARASGADILVTSDPTEALAEADVVYTDVWTSMGQEEEASRRRCDFAGYQLDSAAVARAKKNALVMHCLPAHRGEEISAEVIDGPQSIVFDQAENRLHVQKAILVWLNDRMKKDNQN
jgi:ornithine carbamoyltransferase